jgi:predicted metalloprotease with PDZ domain
MKYEVSINKAFENFIELEAAILCNQPTLSLQLPAWRPGRYELGNFAKNIRAFKAFDKVGNELKVRKKTKDNWIVFNSEANDTIKISYDYYANQLDAGACFINNEQLYINPVHCFMYEVGNMNHPFEVKLNIPSNYAVACQLPAKNNVLFAKNFDQLADSPLIASPNLEHYEFLVDQTNIHFWFQGKHSVDVGQLKSDTFAYTQAQTRIFKELPCKNYHFLYQMLPFSFRHGVEHEDSTVIAMGNGGDILSDEFYNDLLAISSHELFHLWNVKRIRPAEMLPYDFTKENYSTLGYIYEGITTYYGDLMLLRSQVWTWEQYAESWNSDFLRHISNEGKNNYSVAESSFDTWLDGYVPGIKGRKVSIYIEGMLAAMLADLIIIKNSDGKHSLDNVLHDLYHLYYKQNKGYTEEDYKLLLEKYGKESFESYFEKIIWGKNNLVNELQNILPYFGCYINDYKLITTENTENNLLFNFFLNR